MPPPENIIRTNWRALKPREAVPSDGTPCSSPSAPLFHCNLYLQDIQPKFSATFYFGDSILDTGNNNHIPTLAVAKHFPYGRDFPGMKPTGRFSNGRLVSDLLNEKLQLKELSPPFLEKKLSDSDLMTEVNLASAGSGFDDQTSHLSNTLPMSRELDLFKDYLLRLRNIAGDKEASRIIAKCQL